MSHPRLDPWGRPWGTGINGERPVADAVSSRRLPAGYHAIAFADGTLGITRGPSNSAVQLIVELVPSHSRRGPRGQFVPVRTHRRRGWGEVEVLARVLPDEPWTTVYEGAIGPGLEVAMEKKAAHEYVRVLEKARVVRR